MAGVQHLTGVSTGGNKRVVAQGVGVAVGGALLVVAVHLAHGGVQVHGHRPIAWAGTGGPGPGEELLGEPVELAHMPEGGRAQERAQPDG
jgi:hypothetical protein